MIYINHYKEISVFPKLSNYVLLYDEDKSLEVKGNQVIIEKVTLNNSDEIYELADILASLARIIHKNESQQQGD
jgi:hypothetical protein